MELTPSARILARSHREAMDWSLVLVSQGIETTIEGPLDGSGWGLVVPPADYEKALGAIRQYRMENRGWPWQQQVFRPGFLFDWASLAWVAVLALFFWLDARLGLQSAGLMHGTAVAHGQWWRLFTAVWLHADLGHLATNAAIGLILLGLAMGRYGTGNAVLAAYLAGAGGNVAAWLLSLEPHRSLGASGMVMGSLGLLAAQSLSLWPQHPGARKYLLTGMGAGIMLFMLLGLTPGTDVMAHLGGFVGGLALGAVLLLVPVVAHKPLVNLISGLSFACLVVLPWYLALSHSRPADL